jgi:hypothetical protein
MTPEKQTPEERREAAAIRRRWITLGEVLAVVGVIISGLALWNSYVERESTEAERKASEAERAADKARERAVSHTLLLKATGSGKRLALAPHDPEQAIQSQTLFFPSALGVGAVDTVIEPRIEAEWIKQAVKKAREAKAAGKKSAGDSRFPIAITTRFASGGETLTDAALYDVGYKADEGGLLGGFDVELRGLSLVARVRPSEAQKRLDALWAARSK